MSEREKQSITQALGSVGGELSTCKSCSLRLHHLLATSECVLPDEAHSVFSWNEMTLRTEVYMSHFLFRSTPQVWDPKSGFFLCEQNLIFQEQVGWTVWEASLVAPFSLCDHMRGLEPPPPFRKTHHLHCGCVSRGSQVEIWWDPLNWVANTLKEM